MNKKEKFLVLAALCSGSVLAQVNQPFSGAGLGLRVGESQGTYSLGAGAYGYKLPLTSAPLQGPSVGISLEYLFPLGNFRFGPAWTSDKVWYKASRAIGNKYVSFDTGLNLKEMHSLRLMAGYVFSEKIMLYAFAGIAAAHGDIYAQLSVLEYSKRYSDRGWVGGHQRGVGLRYSLPEDSEIGVEFASVDFGKDFYRCYKDTPACATLAVGIPEKTFVLTWTKRF